MTAEQDVRYLLFDVESVADGDLIARTRYAGAELDADQAISKFRNELLVSSGRDFIPFTYHVPVAVVIAKLRADFSIVEVVSLDAPQHRPHVITKHFWTGWEAYQQPTWVTFNGRSFDIPLMEHAAFRYGVSAPKWFNLMAKSYEQSRNRYNLQSHLDLHDVMTNFGATWYRGGLNLAASLLGKPGKMDVQGDMVYDLYREGRIGEINEYCRCDVLDTYFVFLRCMLMMGRIDLDHEKRLVEATQEMLQLQSNDHPAYAAYLEKWGDWDNPWAETQEGQP